MRKIPFLEFPHWRVGAERRDAAPLRAMKLPWSNPKLPVIDLSRFHLEKSDAKAWMILRPQSEKEADALQKVLRTDAVMYRLTKGCVERRRRANIKKEENSVEFYSRLERIAVTPHDNFIAIESQLWIVKGEPTGRWTAYVCPPANYGELERDFDAEQVRINQEIRQL